MKFINVTAAIAAIVESKCTDSEKKVLFELIGKYAIPDFEVEVIIDSEGCVSNIEFKSDTAVDEEIDLEACVISVHTTGDTCYLTRTPKITNTQDNQNQTSSTEEPAEKVKQSVHQARDELAMKIGKGVLYAGAAIAVGAGAWYAWKKWGSSPTSV